MVSIKSVLTAITAAAVLSGCASNPNAKPYIPYELGAPHLDAATNSRALVLTRAVGIKGLSDVEAKNHDIASKKSENERAFDNTVSLMQTGTSKVQGANLGLGSALILGAGVTFLLSDSSAKEDRFFAWMPEDMANSTEDAQDKLNRLVVSAFEKSIAELSAELSYTSKDAYWKLSKTHHNGGSIISADNGCLARMCTFDIMVQRPRAKLAAPGITNLGNSWVFSAADLYSRIELDFPKESFDFETLILKKVSENLPEWIYFYRSPKEIKVNDKDAVAVPYVLNSGKELHFEKP